MECFDGCLEVGDIYKFIYDTALPFHTNIYTLTTLTTTVEQHRFNSSVTLRT